MCPHNPTLLPGPTPRPTLLPQPCSDTVVAKWTVKAMAPCERRANGSEDTKRPAAIQGGGRARRKGLTVTDAWSPASPGPAAARGGKSHRKRDSGKHCGAGERANATRTQPSSATGQFVTS